MLRMKTLLRFFFRLLYHQFAFTYDLVAATVSLGRWKDWVLSVVPFIEGTRILEIGHGPGHLQRALLEQEPARRWDRRIPPDGSSRQTQPEAFLPFEISSAIQNHSLPTRR